ncbi:MAG: hypothetical protein PHE43_00355 [Candidatus Nanoarchaeia archaeon]|nr:hypothetical protein [Candidatus Nanoarchaeia archaeon]
MKKIFLALILFGAVFAGVSLACVCYINPDGSDAWCDPEGCNTEGSYCVETDSYCKIGTKTLTCCEGRCDSTTKKCIPPPATCKTETQTCNLNSDCCVGFCSINPQDSADKHCCKTNYYWDGKYCTTPDYCSPYCYGSYYYPNTLCVISLSGGYQACCGITINSVGEIAGARESIIIY